jgi:hypothetical protein
VIKRPIELLGLISECTSYDMAAITACDFNRAIGAAGINDEDYRAPARACYLDIDLDFASSL